MDSEHNLTKAAKPAAAFRVARPLSRKSAPSDKPAPHQDLADIAGARLPNGDVQRRIEVIRHGIPAASVGQLAARMGVSKEYLINSLRLSRATISRKEREGTMLSSDESERVLGVETLIEMTRTMVEQSGDPAGFDAPRWVAAWLTRPLPALGGATPASYMDTFEGQKLVARILSMSQSGAYA